MQKYANILFKLLKSSIVCTKISLGQDYSFWVPLMTIHEIKTKRYFSGHTLNALNSCIYSKHTSDINVL